MIFQVLCRRLLIYLFPIVQMEIIAVFRSGGAPEL